MTTPLAILRRALHALRVGLAFACAGAFLADVALAFYAVGVHRWTAVGGAVEVAFVLAAAAYFVAPRPAADY